MKKVYSRGKNTTSTTVGVGGVLAYAVVLVLDFAGVEMTPERTGMLIVVVSFLGSYLFGGSNPPKEK